MGFWDELKSGTKQASTKMLEAKDIAKLNLEISEETRQIEKLYMMLGRQFYETQKDAACAKFPETVSTIDQRFSRIAACRERIQTLKGDMPCPNCGAMMAGDELFCAVCGTPRSQQAVPKEPVPTEQETKEPVPTEQETTEPT